jgi:hypothetical protein
MQALSQLSYGPVPVNAGLGSRRVFYAANVLAFVFLMHERF